MTPFRSHTGAAALIDRDNLDTDQIIPARFLKSPRAAGYGQFLFRDQRFDEREAAIEGFPLNSIEPPTILVAGKNFGCGSSREGAVYALVDYGIRAVIAPSFGPIFLNNSFRNGLLALALPEGEFALVKRAFEDAPAAQLTVDLEKQSIGGPALPNISFSIDAFTRQMLIEGFDEIDFTLQNREAIEAFRSRYKDEFRGIY